MSGTGYGTPAPPGAPQGYGPPQGAGPAGPVQPSAPHPYGTPLPPPPGSPVPPAPPGPQGGMPPAAAPVPRRTPAGRGTRRSLPPAAAGMLAAAPPRRVVIGSLIGAVVGGSLLGLVMGVLSPVAPPKPRVESSNALLPSASPTGKLPVAGTPSRGASASPSASGKVRTSTRSEDGPPNAHIDHPDRDMQLMILEDVWIDGEGLVLRGKPARLLSGAKARAAYEKRQEEPKEFAVEETGDVVEIRVRGDATLFGERYIGYSDHQELKQMGRDEFRERARNAIDSGHRPPVWVKRSFGIEGPGIYVAEQYLG